MRCGRKHMDQDVTGTDLTSYTDSPARCDRHWFGVLSRLSNSPDLDPQSDRPSLPELVGMTLHYFQLWVRLQDTHREMQESEGNSCDDYSIRKRERTVGKWTQEIETGLTGKSGVHGCRCSSGLISFLRPALTLSLNMFYISRIS